MAKILFLSDKAVGRQMSGLGLRVHELAKILAVDQRVAIAGRGTGFGRFLQELIGSDIVIVQIYYFRLFRVLLARLLGKRIVVDAYSPFHLEHLETEKGNAKKSALMQKIDACRIRFLFAAGDHFLCASERQIALWAPWLAGVGKKDAVPALVPTGIRVEPPVQKRHLLRGGVAGIAASDTIVLWSSGIWPWLDPLTAVEAIALVRDEKVKLVFFGLAALDPSVKGDKQPQLRAAVDLAREKDLLDKRVFFVNQRTPYDEMGDYLLDADIALNLHFDTPETRYAFRGRLLDYLWAGLPVVTTTGDVLSARIAAAPAGIIVDYQKSAEVAAALERLAADRRFAEQCRQNSKKLAAELVWPRAAAPLAEYCRRTERSRRGTDGPLLWYLAGAYWFSALYLLKYLLAGKK